MVFLDDHLLSAAEDSSDDERSALSPEEAPDPPSSSSIPSQTHSQLVVEVRGHGHPARVDLSVSHSISSLSREVEMGRRAPSPGAIPVRSVTSLRSLFDFAGSSSTYGHGRELGGRSSVLALQVPASSLPPPLTASAMVDSFQISASTAFFSTLPSGEQGLLDAGPSTRESMPCMPCQASQNSHSAPVSSDRIDDPVNSGVQTPHSCASGQGEIVRRLTEVLQGRGDEDFVLQSTGRDNMMSQWLQALDVHVVGACRADERLRPMLRWNVACCDADGCLLAHLSQHFKAKELGMLARCLCAPLVSIRVGKILRQGRFLCPTSSRGYLSLTMLPCSEMRLSFIGDNGVIERIATVKSVNEDTHVTLEMLDPDSSGRSFALKLSGGNHFFWQSQRSKIVGDELVAEMKDLLTRTPTLSQLTGVHESRLDSFVSQLQNALAATSTQVGFQQSYTMPSSLILPSNAADTSSNVLSSSGPRQSQRLSGSRSIVRPMNGIQGSLSPRASGFKEGAFRGLMNVRSVMSLREKHRRCLDNSNSASALTFSSAHRSSNIHINPDLGCVSQPPMTTCVAVCISREERVAPRMDCAGLNTSSSYVSDLRGLLHNDVASFPKQVFSVPVVTSSLPASPNLLPSLLGGSSFSSSGLHPPMPSHLPIPTSTLLAPYYCPCPLRSSALQYTITPPFLPPASETSTVPSSSSFFSVKPSSAILSQTTISLDRVSISPIPLPVCSLVNIPTPLQTSSLPLFFSDPIVHIPVIDFQSANQSFLVSAPPAISSSGIPPILPSFLSNILPGVERSADGQELPALSIFQGLGVAPCLSEEEHSDSDDVQPFLIDSRFRALLASCSEDRPAKDGVEQVTDASWCARLESLRSSAHDTIPQYSGPLLGMVPAILTSGSLSCVLNFCQERSTKATAWVSGSRGLYGGSCEPGIPAPSIAGCSSSLGASVRGTDNFQMSKNKGLRADSVDTSLNGSPKDREDKLADEESRKEG